MKSVIVLVVLVVCVYAAPGDDQTIVLRNDNYNDGLGEYSYTVELSDGTIRHEEATWADIGKDTQHLAVKGYFIYQTPEGQYLRTDYKSDIKGFRPKGDHIPPIPAAED